MVWSSDERDGAFTESFGQRYAGSDAPLGCEFPVNTYTTGDQSGSRYSRLGWRAPPAEFVVVWDDLTRSKVVGGATTRRAPRRAGSSRSTTGAPVTPGDRPSASTIWQLRRELEADGTLYATRPKASATRRTGRRADPGSRRLAAPSRRSLADPGLGRRRTRRGVGQPESGGRPTVRGQRFGGLRRRPARRRARQRGAGAGGDRGRAAVVAELQRRRPDVRRDADRHAGPPAGRTRSPTAPATTGRSRTAPPPCTDCYGVASPARARPCTGTRRRSRASSPTRRASSKQWLLHVGDSFTDVPRGQRFYRFVETLLHRGVTGGCAADAYCPATPRRASRWPCSCWSRRRARATRPPACADAGCSPTSPRAAPSVGGSRSWRGAAVGGLRRRQLLPDRAR